jgi:hypothetical protein
VARHKTSLLIGEIFKRENQISVQTSALVSTDIGVQVSVARESPSINQQYSNSSEDSCLTTQNKPYELLL